MQSRKTYRQRGPDERMKIASMYQAPSSLQPIANSLGRLQTTISRELARNVAAESVYERLPAHALSQTLRTDARDPPKLHSYWV